MKSTIQNNDNFPEFKAGELVINEINTIFLVTGPGRYFNNDLENGRIFSGVCLVSNQAYLKPGSESNGFIKSGMKLFTGTLTLENE